MRLFPKLALLVSGLLLAAVMGLSALYYVSEERLIRQAAQAHQQELLQNLVLIAQDAYFSTDDILLATYTHSLLKWNPELISASVVDPHGRIKAHSEPHNIGKMSDGAAPSSALLLSQSVKYGHLYLGTASVMFSQKVLDALLQARLAELQKRVLSLTVIVLFLGLAASFGMALSWTRPIKRVIAGAEAIGRGRWDVDLGGSERRSDELGILSRSIGAMAGELKELDQMKEDFVTAVTHELRSPLGAIECFLNKIADERRLGRPPTQWDDYSTSGFSRRGPEDTRNLDTEGLHMSSTISAINPAAYSPPPTTSDGTLPDKIGTSKAGAKTPGSGAPVSSAGKTTTTVVTNADGTVTTTVTNANGAIISVTTTGTPTATTAHQTAANSNKSSVDIKV